MPGLLLGTASPQRTTPSWRIETVENSSQMVDMGKQVNLISELCGDDQGNVATELLALRHTLYCVRVLARNSSTKIISADRVVGVGLRRDN